MFHLLLVSVQRGEVECCIALDYLLNRSPWELYMFIFRFLLSIAYMVFSHVRDIVLFAYYFYICTFVCLMMWCGFDPDLSCYSWICYSNWKRFSYGGVWESYINFSSRELLLLFSKHTKCTILMHNLNTTSIMQFFVQH